MDDERQAQSAGHTLPEDAEKTALLDRLARAESAWQALAADSNGLLPATAAGLRDVLGETHAALRAAADGLGRARAELAARARKLALSEALNRIGADVSSADDSGETIRRAAAECCATVGSEAVAVAMRDGTRWTVRYTCGFAGELLGQVFAHEELRPLLRLLRRGQLLVRDARHDPRIDRDFALRHGIRGALVVPLLVRAELVGILALLYRSGPARVPADTVLFTHRVAALISLTLDNVRLLDERTAAQAAAQRRAAEAEEGERVLALLYRLGHTLTATLDPERVGVQLVQAAAEIFAAEGCSIWLWKPDEPGVLVCQTASRPEWEYSAVGQRLAPGQGIAGWVAQHDVPAVVPDAHRDPRFYPGIDERTGFTTRSVLAAPLRARDTVIGTLEVVNRRDGTFDGRDSALLETLASSAAIAIDNARLVAELRRQTVELQGRNEELNAFAHTVAHDLQNPLGLIIGFSAVLTDAHGDMPAQERGRYLATIQRHARKMSTIIEELLLLADVGRAGSVRYEALDMGPIVAEARLRVAHLAEESRAEIVMPDEWPVAWGYAPWIEEVWDNYLSNAIKYGGQPPRIEIGAGTLSNGMVRFWVRDNGAGLKPEDQARLFRSFTRLDQARATGHGLGLSVVRRIVERLGGQVSVESTPGNGSVFSFTLPAGPAPS